MDFDIGNLLYIVITIVAVAVGLLGKKKKPAPGSGGDAAGEKRPSFMENLERVLAMGQEEPLVADLKPYEEDLPAEEMDPAETMEVINHQVNSPGILDQYESLMNRRADEESMLVAMEVEDLDHVPGTDYFEIVKDFDAGTAVVYSAIINRLDI